MGASDLGVVGRNATEPDIATVIIGPCDHKPETIKINPVTGNQYIDRARSWNYWPAEISLKFPVPGLTAWDRVDGMVHFEWRRAEPTDSADAIDAQCRAGWNDLACGFYAFKFEDGLATWSCMRSRE